MKFHLLGSDGRTGPVHRGLDQDISSMRPFPFLSFHGDILTLLSIEELGIKQIT